jgi:hypothetical protein
MQVRDLTAAAQHECGRIEIEERELEARRSGIQDGNRT